jgi:hypothetical protein
MTAQAAQLFPMEDCDNSWRDEVFEFLTEKLEQIVEQNPMEKIDDITGAIFRNKSEILGQFILGFIKKNYNDLLNQQYCDCPICGKRLKAWNEKAKRTIESLGGRLDLYRPYFYCKKCKHGFCPLDDFTQTARYSRCGSVAVK